MPRTDRRIPRWTWLVAAGCALAVLPAGLLTGFVVRAVLAVGAGDEQRSLPDELFPHRLLEYGHPLYVGALGCAGVGLAAAIWGLLQPRSWYPLVPALLAPLAGAALMNAGQLSEGTISPGGAFQRDAVAEAKRVVEAAHPDASFQAFGVDPAAGWNLTLLAFAALAVVAGFTFGWRVRVPWWLPLSVAAVAIVVVLALPGANCGGDDFDTGDPDTHPLGRFVVYACLVLLPVGLGMMADRGASRNRRFAGGLPCAIGGPLLALVLMFLLALMDCAGY